MDSLVNSELKASCQGCGKVDTMTRPALERAGWDWFTGFRDRTAFWCKECQLNCTSAYRLDMKDAYTKTVASCGEPIIVGGIDPPFTIGLRKHPSSGHTWMVEGLVLNDVEVRIAVSSPSMSAECKQQIADHIAESVQERRWRTRETKMVKDK